MKKIILVAALVVSFNCKGQKRDTIDIVPNQVGRDTITGVTALQDGFSDDSTIKLCYTLLGRNYTVIHSGSVPDNSGALGYPLSFYTAWIKGQGTTTPAEWIALNLGFKEK